MATFSDVLAGVEVTPGEASQILYAWAAGFHDGAPELAAKLRTAADKQAYPSTPETKSDDNDSHTTTRRRVTAE